MKSTLLLFLLILVFNGQAQQNAQVRNIQLTIHGGSNVHDWQSDATEVRINGSFQKSNGSLSGVEGLRVTVPVRSIKSEKGRTMDNKTYESLKEKEHPEISFKSESISISDNSVSVKGSLRIAGQSRPATLNAQWKSNGSIIAVSGRYDLLMSDFGISPPTALLGTMKTTDAVSLEYSFEIH